jgi:phosphohistidine phosphatase SixA
VLGEGGFRADVLASGGEAVLLVGHEPTLSSEIGRLTGGSVRLRKGGLAVIRSSRLELLAGPDLLGLTG